MANHKSAAKRARQSLVKTARNKSRKGSVRSAEKKLRTALTSTDAEKTPSLLASYVSQLAKAVKKGIFHKKTLARKQSRLAKAANATLSA